MITYRVEVARVTRNRQIRWETLAGWDGLVGGLGYEAAEAARAAIANRINGARFRMGRQNKITRGQRRTLRDCPRAVVAVRIMASEA